MTAQKRKKARKKKQKSKTIHIRKMRKPDAEVRELVDGLTMMSDTMFFQFAKDEKALEEMIQVLLCNPKIRVKPGTAVPQKTINFLGKRGIRVDAYAEGNEDEVFNVEIQRANDDDHARRVRYNASAITVWRSETGDTFRDVQDVYVIFISETDFLGTDLPIVHACMTIQETGKPLNDGLQVVYANIEKKFGDEEEGVTPMLKKAERYLGHLKDKVVSDDEFPETSRRTHEVKHKKEEVDEMCAVVEQYGEKKQKETQNEFVLAIDRLKKGETVESLIKSGINERTAHLAKGCI